MKILKTIVFFTTLILALELLLTFSGASPAAFAKPSEVFLVIPQFLNPTKFGDDTFMTLMRSIIAFLISFPLGLAIGAFAVKVPKVDAQCRSLVDFLRSIPGTSLVPIFFIIFGIGEISKIAAAVYGGALTTAIATIVGLQLLSVERKTAVSSVYKSEYLGFWQFEFPEILPTLLVGLRTAISLCLVLVTVAEMFMGTDIGLGSVIMDSRYAGKVELLYAAIFMTGVLGFILNIFAKRIELVTSRAYPRFS